MNSAYHYR
uniref:Uncharacterized protein n=1 Tax=Arundo donax TaxID=35708 RepID=A0A0A9GZM9_ARUDO